MKQHTGSCHCGAVAFTVDTDLEQTLSCNCSHCSRKGFILTFVDKSAFHITAGEDKLTSYQFNQKHIDHLFCSVCGVEPFARGITMPQVAINVRCLHDIDLTSLKPTEYNGKDA